MRGTPARSPEPGGRSARDDGGRAFAFKLHQFIGQGRALFATLEPAGRREFSLEGQVQAGQGRIFAPIKFCRQCGQDYYHVLWRQRFQPHPVGVEGDLDGRDPGYLMLASGENDWEQTLMPAGVVRPPRPAHDDLAGSRAARSLGGARRQLRYGSRGEGRIKMWWQPAPFCLCLSCGEYYTTRDSEFGKLASISSEARSSATTVLSTSLLRHAGPSGRPATRCCPSRTIGRTPRCRRAISTTSFTFRCCESRAPCGVAGARTN